MKLKQSLYLIITLLSISLVIINDLAIIKLLSQYHILDKTGHFIGFFLLSWILDTILKLRVITSIISIIIYAGLTEVTQEFLGFRNGQLSDFIADALGCLCYFLCLKLYKLTKVRS